MAWKTAVQGGRCYKSSRKWNTDPQVHLVQAGQSTYKFFWLLRNAFFLFLLFYRQSLLYALYQPSITSGEMQGKRGGRGERKSCQHWAAAQPMLDCRYKHYTLHQQSCGEWAINFPGGALQGRLTMQVQSHCVIWRHPGQLKIHCSL